MIISVINNKGGTAKTTTSVNLGVALARLGGKTLVVDVDNQCNTTDILHDGTGDPIIKNLYDIMDPSSQELDINGCIYETVHDGLYLLPNIPDSAMLGPKIVMGGKKTLFLLRQRLREYALENYKFTILDCPPNLESFVISSLIASDFVIVPTMAGSRFSLNGLIKAKCFIDDIRLEHNPDLKFLKLLLTMVDSRTSICKKSISAIRKAFPIAEVFNQTIPINTDFQKAEACNQSIFKYRIGAPGATAYLHVAQEVIEIVGRYNKEKL